VHKQHQRGHLAGEVFKMVVAAMEDRVD